jgi:hypothetical protein
MSAPQQPSDAVPHAAGTPTPAWAAPAPEWVAHTPAWPVQPNLTPTPARPAGTSPRSGSPVAAAAVAAAVLSVGILVAALLSALVVSTVLAGRADEVGRGIGSALGEELGDSMAAQTEALLGTGGLLGGYGYGPVEQTDPVPPGVLGTDATLDGYAQECFTGDHDACDRLYLESAPFSEYERYGSTCGGRVKPLAVGSCTELD